MLALLPTDVRGKAVLQTERNSQLLGNPTRRCA
jgi:hypothetical protein